MCIAGAKNGWERGAAGDPEQRRGCFGLLRGARVTGDLGSLG